MDEKIKEIDAILKSLYNTCLNYENGISDGSVYNFLRNYNLKPEERNYDISPLFFKKWIDRFSNVNDINVFVNPNWKYFCQFRNDIPSLNCYKLYIPLDYQHLYEGANRLFDFITKNKIKHTSKIASHLRTDNIVIRLSEYNDVKKVLNFVKNDAYINEGLIKTNPFCFSKNGVGLSYDGNLSYNSVVASLIAEYLNDAKNKKETKEEININNFYNFVDDITKSWDKIAILMEKYNFYDEDNPETIVHLCFISDLLKTALKSNDINVYYTKLKYYLKAKTKKEFLASYKSYVENKNIQIEMQEDKVNQIEKEQINNDKIALLEEFVLTAVKKYPKQNIEQPYYYDYLSGYLLYNNKNCITRDHDLRNRITNNLNKEEALKIIENSYCSKDNLFENINNYITMISLNDIIKTMKEKMPDSYIINLDRFLITNQVNFITRTNDARIIAENISSSAIKDLFKSLNVTNIFDYIENYYNKITDNRHKKD